MKISNRILILLMSGVFLLHGCKTSYKTPDEHILAYVKSPKNVSPPMQKEYHAIGITLPKDCNMSAFNQHLISIYKTHGNKRYRYDPNQNYMYDFNHSRATIRTMSFKKHILHLPNNIQNVAQSSFLKLTLWHTPLGELFPVSVFLTQGKKTYRHEFEIGASGVRYINISDLNLVKGASIKIEGKFATIPDQNVTLIQYRNPEIKKKTILVLAPHPDDAEIASYGLYSHHASQTYVITVTAGEQGREFYPELYNSIAERYLEKGKFRTWNSLTIPLLGGVKASHCVNLGFFDYTLRSMFNHPETIATGSRTHVSDINQFRQQNTSSLAEGLHGDANWVSLVQNNIYLLKKIQPDIIVMPYPAIDMHPDHKYTSVAMLEAIKKLNMHSGQLYLYTNHLVLSEYYPFGQRGESVDLPPIVQKPIYFDSLYVHLLTKKNENEKALVLEAMNDLRPQLGWYLEDKRCNKGAKIDKSFYADRYGNDISYFRRAVRSNELFFVVDVNHIYNQHIFDNLVYGK